MAVSAVGSTAVAGLASSTHCQNVSRAWGMVETIWTEPFTVLRAYLQDDGTFPNNEEYPLLVYQSALTCGQIKQLGKQKLISNGWTDPWAWGVFQFHHYHSNAWEALLCVAGSAKLQFGGPLGPNISATLGDLILIPPGVAHKQLEASADFTLLGSYPNETPNADTVRSSPSQAEMQNIISCPVPASDPLFGIGSAPWGQGIRALF